MTKEEVLDQLREKTKADPILNATMHMLALRKRPRHNLTLDGLYYRMKREGFDHPKKEYLRVLQLLGDLGLAKIITDFKGEPQQARDFRLSLPLIGAAACGSNVPLSKMGKLISQNRTPMVTQNTPELDPAVSQTPPIREPRAPRPYQTPGSRLILTMLVNDKPVNIPIPKTLTPDELSTLIAELWDLSEGLDKKYGK